MDVENKIKSGASDMLKVFLNSKRIDLDTQKEIELQIEASNAKLAALKKQFDDVQGSNDGRRKEDLTIRARRKALRQMSDKKLSVDLNSASSRSISMASNLRPNRGSDIHGSQPLQQPISGRRSTSRHKRSESDGATPLLVSRFSSEPSVSNSVTSANSLSEFGGDVNVQRGVGPMMMQIMNNLALDNVHPQLKIDSCNKFVKILRNVINVEDYQPIEHLITKVRAALGDPVQEVRACAYRVLRYAITTVSHMQAAIKLNLDFFIIRSLMRSKTYEVEREQAFKLVRSWLDLPSYIDQIGDSLSVSINEVDRMNIYNMASEDLETTYTRTDSVIAPSSTNVSDTSAEALGMIKKGITSIPSHIAQSHSGSIGDASISSRNVPIGMEPSNDSLDCAEAIPSSSRAIQAMPRCIWATIVSIAEQLDDPMSLVCIETLCELVVKNVRVASFCGGTRCLSNILKEGKLPITVAKQIVNVFIFALDAGPRRRYLRSAVELESVLSILTDVYSKDTPNLEARMTISTRILVEILRHWTGIMYLCVDGKRVFKSIVDALRLPYPSIRKVIIEMFFELFFIDSRKYSVDLNSDTLRSVTYDANDPDSAYTYPDIPERQNLIHNYLTILIVIFIDAGLIEALIECLDETSGQMTEHTIILIGEVLDLCDKYLPASSAIKIQSLPKLFERASKFSDEDIRHFSTAALEQIHRLRQSKRKIIGQSASLMNNEDRTSKSSFSSNGMAKLSTGSGSKSNSNNERHARRIEYTKIKLGIQMDDSHFRNLLADSQVLSGKEYIQWDWDVVGEIVQGPLLHPKRLEEAIRNTKFVKRLLSFYRPSKMQFTSLSNIQSNTRYIKVGCALLRALLLQPEGIKFVEQHPILSEIAAILDHLDPIHGSTPAEHIFSKEKLTMTLSGEYFSFIGVFSRYAAGVRILEKFKIFNLLYRLTELRSRDDLVRMIITRLDYSTDTHARIILSKVLISGTKSIRMFATSHLRRLVPRGIPDFSIWAIPLLLTQLYDPSLEVCEIAVIALDEACREEENLEVLISFRPSLDHLGEIGNPLMLRFLSTSQGFQYLFDLKFLEREMDDWAYEGNELYVKRTELLFSRALTERATNRLGHDHSNDASNMELGPVFLSDAHGSTPPHFFGELTKTREGCELLKEKGYFDDFSDLIRERGLRASNQRTIMALKAVLWAVGHIGSSETGLPFLEEEDIIKDIVNIAENSSVLSVKGTCYYVLGLIAKTAKGILYLHELGWETIIPTASKYLPGVCIPINRVKLLSMPHWKFSGSWPKYLASMKRKYNEPHVRSKVKVTESSENEILKYVGNLGNHIIAGAASKWLTKAKFEKPNSFNKVDLYLRTIEIFDSYHFRLPVRRFVCDLFHPRITIGFGAASMESLDRYREPKHNKTESLQRRQQHRKQQKKLREQAIAQKSDLNSGRNDASNGSADIQFAALSHFDDDTTQNLSDYREEFIFDHYIQTDDEEDDEQFRDEDALEISEKSMMDPNSTASRRHRVKNITNRNQNIKGRFGTSLSSLGSSVSSSSSSSTENDTKVPSLGPSVAKQGVTYLEPQCVQSGFHLKYDGKAT